MAGERIEAIPVDLVVEAGAEDRAVFKKQLKS